MVGALSLISGIVMAGLDPAIHEFFALKTWMAGTSPAMTKEESGE